MAARYEANNLVSKAAFYNVLYRPVVGMAQCPVALLNKWRRFDEFGSYPNLVLLDRSDPVFAWSGTRRSAAGSSRTWLGLGHP
ncbi:hypothetical protein BOS5A_210534 [Bosea sp. EC-HK365B]|nr:hypothetical protein BOSE7B_120396 [Bosea sp. 7B]CAD5277673.1 hypothetical protein BOSE21B_30518 [Bosea sp. 21B]VVT59743.1 hypothetical protein BOS5A_210534 [Bosea sp. EC-HK365B]